MARTWIVVAHRAGCRLLECTNDSSSLTLIEDIDHPKGRLQDRDIETDAQGRTYSSAGIGQSRYSPRETTHDHIAKVFAGSIVSRLESARNERKFDDVVLVAEPKFLGMLRDQLSSPLEKMVSGSVDKDLYLIPTSDIPKHLGDVLRAR